MKNHFILFSIALIFICGCKKEVPSNFPPVENQLIIQSFIAPQDDSIEVRLDYSKNYFGAGNKRDLLIKNIPSAIVSIGEGSVIKKLKWSNRNRCFTISKLEMPLFENKTYKLTIQTTEGLMAEAQTKIPTAIADAELIKSSGAVKNNYVKDKLSLSIKDEKGINNYYEFRLYTAFEYSGTISSNEYYKVGSQLVNDNKDNIEKVIAIFNFERFVNFNGNVGGNGITVKSSYKGFFLKCTEEYYKYLESVELSSNASGNPFSEPVSVYTNIKGGLGIFAAYQIVEKNVPYN